MYQEIIYQNIRAKGGRITKFRDALIKVMLKEACLISLPNLLLCLKKMKLEPNRSTIYRELKFLVKNNIIIKNIISGINYYEISPNYRNFEHHSLNVCQSNKSNYHYNQNFTQKPCQGSSNKDHHHHHLICLQCNAIIKVEVENLLEKQEQILAKKNNFNIVNHSLDFYGYCQKCQA